MEAAFKAAMAASSNNVPATDCSPMTALLQAAWSRGGQVQSVPEAAKEQLKVTMTGLHTLLQALARGATGWSEASALQAVDVSGKVVQLQQEAAALRASEAACREELAEAREVSRVAQRDLARFQYDNPDASPAVAAPQAAQAPPSAGPAVGAGAAAASDATTEARPSDELREELEEVRAERDAFQTVMKENKEQLQRQGETIQALQGQLAGMVDQPVSVSAVQAHPEHSKVLLQLAQVTQQRDVLATELAEQRKASQAAMEAVAAARAAVPQAVQAVTAQSAAQARELTQQLQQAREAEAAAKRQCAIAQTHTQRLQQAEVTVKAQQEKLERQAGDIRRWRGEWKERAGTTSASVAQFVQVLEGKVSKLTQLLSERDNTIEELKAAQRQAARGSAAAGAQEAEMAALDAKLGAARAEATGHRAEREKMATAFTALQATLASAQQERDAATETVDELSEAYEELEGQVDGTLAQLQAKDDVLRDFTGKLAEARAELADAKAEASRHQGAAEAAEGAAQELRKALAASQQQGALLDSQLAEATAAAEAARFSAIHSWATASPGSDAFVSRDEVLRSLTAQRDARAEKVAEFRGLLEQAHAAKAEAEQRLTDAITRATVLEGKLAQFSGQVKTDAAAGSKPADKDTRRKLKFLQSMLMCPVQPTAFKSAVLRKCGHALSKEAIEQRMKDRLRRCPMCNTSFSAEDVISLHLGGE